MTEQLKQSEELFLLVVDDSSRKIRFESIHSSREVVCLDSFGFCESTPLTRASSASADEDHLLSFIDLAHPQWEEMERDISCCRNIDFTIFIRSPDIDEVDFFRRFLEKGSEFFRCESEHLSRVKMSDCNDKHTPFYRYFWYYKLSQSPSRTHTVNILLFPLIQILSHDDPHSPYDRSEHDDHADPVWCQSNNIIVAEHIHHREEIIPIMTLRSHIANQREWASPSVSDIDRHIGEVLSHPPEADCSRELCLFLVVEISSKNQWREALEKTTPEYMEKISEWNHDEMSSFMESEIDSVKKVHRLIVQHSEWEELERVDREDDEEDGPDSKHVVYLL